MTKTSLPSAPQKKTFFHKLGILLVLLIAACWAGVVILKTQTGIKTITCSNCSQAAQDSLHTLLGKSIFTVGKTNLEVAINPHDLSVIEYKKILPSTILVVAAENPPLYGVTQPQQGKSWKVTQAGTYIESNDITSLPLFTTTNHELTQEKLQTLHYSFLALLPFFQTIQPQDNTIRIVAPEWAEFEQKNGITLIFNPTQPEQQSKIVAYLLNNWPTTLPNDTKEIDVRFRLPVVRTQRTKPGDIWTPALSISTESAIIASPSAEL